MAKIEKNLKKQKVFSYNKKTINLGFTLDIEDKDVLVTFLELLETARQDVIITLAELFPDKK